MPVGAISAVVLLEQTSAASRAEPRGELEGARQTQLAASLAKHPRQGIIAVNFWVQLGLASRENMSCSNIQLRRGSFSHPSRTPMSWGPRLTVHPQAMLLAAAASGVAALAGVGPLVHQPHLLDVEHPPSCRHQLRAPGVGREGLTCPGGDSSLPSGSQQDQIPLRSRALLDINHSLLPKESNVSRFYSWLQQKTHREQAGNRISSLTRCLLIQDAPKPCKGYHLSWAGGLHLPGESRPEEQDLTILLPAQGREGDPVALASQLDRLPLQHGHGGGLC